MSRAPSLQRILLGAFVAALVFYASGFALNSYLQQRRGPWEITFSANSQGEALMVIRQPALGIDGTRIIFSGKKPATTEPIRVCFETPRTSIPFGEVIYDDLTYLPGVVTLQVFGHEMELLPRTLYINRKPLSWPEATQVILPPAALSPSGSPASTSLVTNTTDTAIGGS
jgi:hypothetical protein